MVEHAALLITGQGNFGSIHACRRPRCDTPSEAQRGGRGRDARGLSSTRSTSSPATTRAQEPPRLPGKFPNCWSTVGGDRRRDGHEHPAAQPGEVCDGVVALIDNTAIELDELGDHPAPDFPTGGRSSAAPRHREAYRTGRGRVILRAKYDIEEQKDGRSQIIFTEIPYQLTKGPLLTKLAELVHTGRVTGVTDIQDESDRKQPVRIVVKVKKGEDANVVLNQLFQFSPLQDTFSVIMLALVDGRPRTLPLKEFLRLFVEHRINVLRRRTQYQLRQARARAHILEGLLIALAYIDEIIRVIRSSPTRPRPAPRLMAWSLAEILRGALDDRGQGAPPA